MSDRMKLLGALETRFISEKRGSAAEEHAKVLAKTQELLTSEQMKAFQVRSEPKDMVEKYGDNNFGRGCLMARRLVEVGVPFVEVNSGGWDLHQNTLHVAREEAAGARQGVRGADGRFEAARAA